MSVQSISTDHIIAKNGSKVFMDSAKLISPVLEGGSAVAVGISASTIATSAITVANISSAAIGTSTITTSAINGGTMATMSISQLTSSGSYTVSGLETIAGDPSTINLNPTYSNLNSPIAKFSFNSFVGYGSGAVLTLSPALPANMRPAVAQKLPIYIRDNSAFAWGRFDIATNGIMTICATADGGVFTNATEISVTSTTLTWNVVAYA